MTVKAKRFRIGVEGATTDGREIQREWLEQMAASYNPAVYTALINLEHIKSYLPDSTFNRYGKVTALFAEEITEGPLAGKMALYADVEPTESLVELVKKGQKLFTSMEVSPKFADTGKAYLVGLAATDDPASLGTEMLTFSASAAHNPLANRKQNPANLFTAAEETVIELEEIQDDKSGVSWLLDKLGIVSKEAAKAKLPESVTRQQPATVNADGKVMMPSGGFPSWGYGFAGMYDSGGYIPRGQFGIVGENGPEIVNGPANVTSRRNTAALAAVVAGMMGVAAAPAELPPLHPLALPAKGGEAMVSRAATVPPVQRIEAPTQIIIQTQPGQSAQDIAREVARQLDERERRLKAKARSNYSDQGGYDA
ncbi:GPO family capsid scaffolding protein [Escherichia coli]